MVKNIPTIERSTKIRFGKYATDDQAENTIVFNASNTAIDASTAGTMYMSPLRIAELAGATFIGYSSSTKEVVDTGVATSLLGGVTLDSAALQGNVVSNSIPHFANVTTAFTTGHGSNVGISNTAPTHMLSVGDKIFMSNTGEEAIKVEGNVRAQRFFVGQNISLDSGSTNNIQVSGKIKTSSIETTDHIAVSNNQTITKLVSVGSHTFINTPSVSESAITTSGNVTAAFYKGDAGLLSNVIHTGTLPISKGGTGATSASAAASALGLGVEDQPSFVTVSANVNASNIVSSDGRGINQLNASNVSIGTLAIGRGGTGATSASAAASALGLGVEDQPSFVTVSANVNASNIVSSDGRGINQLNASNVSIGTLAIGRGGTGATSASAAASALGLGVEDQPSFVTVNANVNAGNVVTTTIELGHASDTTLARSSAGVVTIEGVEIRTGTVAIAKGGTGATTASSAASALGLGVEDQPSFVTVSANVNAGNVVTTTIELGHASDTTLARSSAGVVTIEGVEIRTGTVAIAKGGTGATTASSAASALGLGVEDQPSFVTVSANVNAGNVVTTTIELGHASDTTLARSGAGVVTIAGSEVRTGTVAITDGGTGQTTAVAAASALGLGTEDSPSFVTVNANVNAGNVTSGSIKLTDPGIVGTFSTDTITINAENRTYGTAPLVVATGDIDSLVLINLIDGAQVVVPILASGVDRVISKDLTNVNFTVITEDVSITQDKHGLMTLSNIAGNVYMNAIGFA